MKKIQQIIENLLTYYESGDIMNTVKKTLTQGGESTLTDTDSLKMLIKESGIKLDALCKACGVTYATLRSKINNESQFTAKEISIISTVLGMTSDQRDSIFFYECG